MNWYIKKFEELTANELYEILRARAEVFVVEQNCVYQDLDEKDRRSYHLFSEENGEIASYARLIEKGVSYEEASIGRLLTRETFRGIQLGRETLERALAFLTGEMKEEKIRISGQLYLLKFYEHMGFKTTSEVYLEDEIEHVQMLYEKS